MTKGDATSGAAPATLQNKSSSDQNDDCNEDDAGRGTIRKMVSLNKHENGLKSSENSGSVPKTSDNGVFERDSHERSDSVVKVSTREAQDLQLNFRPTGGSDKPHYEQATLFNLASINQSNKSQQPSSDRQFQSPGGQLASKNSEQGIDEISRLINEQYTMDTENKDINFIFKDEKLFDQPKKAIYGIQPVREGF